MSFYDFKETYKPFRYPQVFGILKQNSFHNILEIQHVSVINKLQPGVLLEKRIPVKHLEEV